MAAFTLDQARQNLTDALAALANARQVQSYSHAGGSSVQRADHTQLLQEVEFWRTEVTRLERQQQYGGIRVRQGVPA